MCNFREEFKKQLLDIKIPSDATQEKIRDGFRSVFQLINDNIPNKMYRYRACNDYHFEAFYSNTIFACSPIDYNDPYDALIRFDKNSLISQIKYGATLGGLLDFRKRVLNNESLPPEIFEILDTNMVNTFVKEFKRLSEKQLTQNYNRIIKNKIPDFVNNIELFLNQVTSSIQKSSSVACFSEDIESVLMWSHYADSHKGFALEYDNRNIKMECTKCEKRLNNECNQWTLGTIYPVIYTKERFDATEYASYYLKSILTHQFKQPDAVIPDISVFIKAFLHKSLDWKYEKEWRMIFNVCGCSDYSKRISIITPSPIAIYYGSKISKENRRILSEKAKIKGLREYEMFIDDNSLEYKLEYKECK